MLGLFAILQSSCEKYYYIPEEVEIPDTVKFSENVLPIFGESCSLSGCHLTGDHAPDLTPEKAYSNIIAYRLVDTTNAEESILYQRLISKTKPMPPETEQPLTESKINLILEWIRQGAANN